MRKFAILTGYFLIFWVLIPVLIIVISKHLEVLLEIERSRHFFSGIIVLISSVLLLGISIWQYFRFTGNLPVSAYPPKTIIRQGLYNYWRHPIYLFYLTAFIGAALLTGSMTMLLIVLPCFIILTYIYIIIEEKGLTKRFGETYAYYKKQAGLLIPHPYQIIRFPLLALFKILFRYQSAGTELVPDSPPYFLIAEHKNYLDPFFIALSVPHPISYLTTYEAYRSKPLAWFLRNFFSIPKKRFKKDVGSNRLLLEHLGKGGVIGLFPEGERSWTGETQSFKPEVMKFLLRKNEIPIIPVRIEGNYHSWPRWANKFRRCKITVEILKPFYPERGTSARELEIIIKNNFCSQGIPEEFSGQSSDFYTGIDKIVYRCSGCREFSSFAIRQNALTCTNCGMELKVSPNLTLHLIQDGSERDTTIAEYYHAIRVTPEDPMLKRVNQAVEQNFHQNDIIVDLKESGMCHLFAEAGDTFEAVLTGELLLSEDSIVFRNEIKILYLNYINISSITTESNYKLQIYDDSARQLYQVTFIKNNVLMWQDILTSIISLKTGRSINTR